MELEYYLTYDGKTGKFAGWYENTIHSEVPEPHLVVSTGEYLALRNQLSQGRVLTVEDGKPVVRDLPSPDLQTIKLAKVDQMQRDYAQQQVPFATFTNKAGFTAEYGARASDKAALNEVIDAGKAAWTVNLWLDGKGAPVSPMTFADLQGLAQALDAITPPTHTRLLQCISDVLNAASEEEVHGIAL